MDSIYASKLMKQGFLAVLVSLAGGFMLTFYLLGGLSLSPLPVLLELNLPGSAKGWRIVHTGMMMNGLLALAIALAMQRVCLAERAARRVYWGTVIAVWGNFCFYLFGMFAPNRGLSMLGNRLGEASLAGGLAFVPALVGALTLMYACVIMYRALPGGDES